MSWRALALAVGLLALGAAPAQATDLWALTADETLLRFDPADADALVGAELPIVGVPADEELHGLTSFTGVLYAMSLSGTVYRIDPATGVAEWYRPGYMPKAGAQHLAIAAHPSTSIAAVGDADTWLELRPPTSIVHYSGAIAYAGGTPADPQIVATAFQHDAQYGVDVGTDKLVRRHDRGEWTEVGPLGIGDIGAPVALEYANGTLYLADDGKLHTVDTTTGAATAVGTAGDGSALRDLAIVPPPRVLPDTPDELGPMEFVAEGQREEAIVWRVGDPRPQVTAEYVFEDGQNDPGTAGEDYVPGTGTVTFAPGESRKGVLLPNVDDDLVEGTEAFTLRLTSGGPGVDIGFGARVGIVIVDDDLRVAPPPASVTVSESVGSVPLQADRATPLGQGVELRLRPAADATATAGQDYVVPAPLTLGIGGSSGTLTLPVLDDRANEPQEAIVLERASAAPYTRMTNNVVVTVTDDDPPAPRGPDGPAPPPGIPPAVDRTAPQVTFAGGRALRVGRRGPSVTFTCAEACVAALELRVGGVPARRHRLPRRLGWATARAVAGRRTSARIPIARRTLARLRRARSVPATLKVVVTDAAGNRRTVDRRVSLRR